MTTATKESKMSYRTEAEAYYRLVRRAQALGIPTSLDDPRSPKTVDGLAAAVAQAEEAR
jgi:hypothetical protein